MEIVERLGIKVEFSKDAHDDFLTKTEDEKDEMFEKIIGYINTPSDMQSITYIEAEAFTKKDITIEKLNMYYSKGLLNIDNLKRSNKKFVLQHLGEFNDIEKTNELIRFFSRPDLPRTWIEFISEGLNDELTKILNS